MLDSGERVNLLWRDKPSQTVTRGWESEITMTRLAMADSDKRIDYGDVSLNYTVRCVLLSSVIWTLCYSSKVISRCMLNIFNPVNRFCVLFLVCYPQPRKLVIFPDRLAQNDVIVLMCCWTPIYQSVNSSSVVSLKSHVKTFYLTVIHT